ncbi:uncharacterized protein METZ01_LOCUS348964, partial [marine metagenome]
VVQLIGSGHENRALFLSIHSKKNLYSKF